MLAQASDTGGGLGVFWIAWLAFWILFIVAGWRLFEKAGQPGWASLVPIYNAYVMLKIVGRPAWWLILMVIPFVNFIVWIVVALDLAKSFGQGSGFGVGLVLLPWIFLLILAFGDARYVGPAGGTPTMVAPPPPPAPAG
jgi:hypothetical protein